MIALAFFAAALPAGAADAKLAIEFKQDDARGQKQVSFYNALYSGTGDKKNPRPPYRDHIRNVAITSTTAPGGSYFHPQGSGWYFPNKIELNTHGKVLLMAPSKDRAGTLGFRCVVDAAE